MNKSFVALSSAASIVAISVGLSLPVQAKQKLTVVSWGGAFTESQVQAYHKPFAKKTGIELISEDFSGGLAEIKAQVESGNVYWDLVSLDKPDIVRGCAEGLLEPLNPATLLPGDDGTPAADDFVPGAIHECAVASIVVSNILAYDKSRFSGQAAPSRLEDLFDIKSFPGRRALQKQPQGNLEWALIADGVAPDKVYTTLETRAGRDRAFSKLNSIKDSVVWWSAGSQPPQLLADGEVVMTSAFNGRIHNAQKKEGKPFEIIWDHQIGYLNGWAIPKGSKNLKAAQDFVLFTSGTVPLAEQAKYVAYGPSRISSSKLIDAELARSLPTAPDNFKTAFMFDDEWWADYADELNEEFNTWVAR